MRHARHHFAHSRELFLLQLLLFGRSGLRNVASRCHHAIYFPRSIKERAGACPQDPPRSIRVLRPIFKLRVGQVSVGQCVKSVGKRRYVMPVNLRQQSFTYQILRRMAQNVPNSRANESEPPLQVHHGDDVRKAGHQPAHKFLLAV